MSWTLKQPRTRSLPQGDKQTHEAALRASRYTRRHAWQFHGAGVEDAVQELTGLKEFTDTVRNMRVGLAKLSKALDKPAMNDGDAVVGWRSPSGLLLCLKHSHREATPVTADDLPEGGICVRCAVDVLIPVTPPAVTPAECPDCTHAHVEGQQCTSEMGVGFCGCTG